MKIRNKKTGEAVLAKLNLAEDEFRLCSATGRHGWLYRTISLDEFKDEWAAAERASYWYISDEFKVELASVHNYKTARRKVAGNYYTSEKEAEDALFSLKRGNNAQAD